MSNLTDLQQRVLAHLEQWATFGDGSWPMGGIAHYVGATPHETLGALLSLVQLGHVVRYPTPDRYRGFDRWGIPTSD